MCTMTWIHEPERYQVFFNRDEHRNRKPARSPAVRRAGRVRFIAPLDGDFGGSWIGANQLGVTLCLLNGYGHPADDQTAPATGFTSRGLLLTSLIDGTSSTAIVERVAKLDLSRFRSFLLTAIDPSGEDLLATWKGGALAVEELADSHLPLVSSSFDTDEVRASRAELFEAMRREARGDPTELHLAFHESHRPAAGPRSTCMHRPEAQTVSFSWIQVAPRRILFHYSPHSPCKGRPGPLPVVLERAVPETTASS
jgi:hypothetical protein